MDWKKQYQTERRMTWEDAAQAIRDAVTMDDVLEMYAPEIPKRNHRCPCPFHNGKDYNMSYNSQSYHCFVCGCGGDVIAFVKDIRDMSTRADAMKLINADLHLNIPIGGTVSESQNAEIAKRRAEVQAKQKAKDEWLEQYHELLDAWIENDIVKRDSEPFSDAWVTAVKNLEILSYKLDSLPEEPR